MNIVIRKLELSDIESCVKICDECFKIEGYHYNTRFEFESQFTSGYIVPEFYIAEKELEIIGVMGLSQLGFDSAAFGMCTAYIKPDYQNKGIGRQLFISCLNRVKELNGKVVFVTSKKSKFVKSLGFNQIPTPTSYEVEGWKMYQFLID